MDHDLLKKLKGICNSLNTDHICAELNKVSSNYEAWNSEGTNKIFTELRDTVLFHEFDDDDYEQDYKIQNKLKDIMKNHYDDKDIVIKCVLIDGTLIDEASKRLLNDIDVARAAVLLSMNIEYDYSMDIYAFIQLSDELKDNKDFVLEAIKNNNSIVENVSERLLNDKDVVIAAGSKGLKATKSLNNDREVLIAIAKNNPFFLENASPSVRKNIEIVFICCRLQPMLIQYAHPDLISELIMILYQRNQKNINKRSIKNG